MRKDPAHEAYFAEAITWDADRAAMNARSMRIAWRVAVASVVVTLAAIVAILCMLPLKRVEPYLIRVDNTTGVVDVVPAFTGNVELPEAVTRYFLYHYITTCERFNYATARTDYDECAAFHAPRRNQAWAAQWDPTRADSPVNLYKDGSTVRVQVASITFLKHSSPTEKLAQIRYTKAKRAPGAIQENLTHWLATVSFVFVKPSAKVNYRQSNPLGFKILEFHAEPEIVSTSVTVAAP